MIEKGVNLAEPSDIETLNLATINVHEWNEIEYVRIGCLAQDMTGPDGTVSFQLVQFGPKYIVKALQANLTYAEIDLVIAGLEEAKKKMEKFQEVEKIMDKLKNEPWTNL